MMDNSVVQSTNRGDVDKLSLEKHDDENAIQAVSSTAVGFSDEYSQETYKKITRKIDYYLIPLMFFLYGIQQVDKTSTGTQALFGLREDLNMHGQDYQWLSTIYYMTFLVAEFPSTWLLQRFQAGRVLTIYIFLWATCLLCVSATQTWPQIMAVRALQGIFESNISPGFLLITGSWYRTREHANRSLLWQSSEGLVAIVCQLAVYGVAKRATHAGGIAPWRTISLLLGSLTMVGAVASWFILGTPHEVRWLNREEKKIAITRVLDNKIGEDTTGEEWSWPQFWECFRDPQVYLGILNTFLACIPNGGITTFSSLLYVTFGFTEWESILYSCIRNGIYTVVFVVVGLYLQRFQNQRMYVMLISCILPCAGMLIMSLLPDSPANKWIKFAMFQITVIFSLALFLGWSLITSNISGGTKRTVVSSLTLMSYCVGNMVGAQVFRTSGAPRYIAGTVTCAVCFGAEMLVIVAWRLWYMWENRRRDRAAAASGLTPEEQEREGEQLGKQNLTDLQNPHFRYTM